ncbi:MAG: 4Fe-4S binding protein [Candidatus Helarchaeota archaeon]
MSEEKYIPVRKSNNCGLCSACADVCPQQAIEIEEGEFILDVDKCLSRKMEFCSICVEACRRQILVLEIYNGF